MLTRRVKAPRSVVSFALVVASIATGCGKAPSSNRASASDSVAASAPATVLVSSAPRVVTSVPRGAIRPDIFSGASVPPVKLDQPREYAFPIVPDAQFEISFETRPADAAVKLTLIESGKENPDVIGARRVTWTSHSDGFCKLVLTASSSEVELTSLSVKAKNARFDPNGFRAFVHVAGDSFAGLGASHELGSDADVAALVDALLKQANRGLAASGIQVDVPASGWGRLTSAQVAAVEPGLVRDGKTVLKSATAAAERWGLLGKDASDPRYGKALDVFLVHSTPDTTVGVSAKGPRPQGGRFVGNGTSHAIVLALFDSHGRPVPFDELARTFVHELGHFFSLAHTTELDFTPGDLARTPHADRAQYDRNANGELDVADLPCPDEDNLMFPLSAGQPRGTLTVEQVNAMKGYLSLREH